MVQTSAKISINTQFKMNNTDNTKYQGNYTYILKIKFLVFGINNKEVRGLLIYNYGNFET